MALMSRSGVLCVSFLIAAMASAYAQQQEGVTPAPAPPATQPAPAPPQEPYLLEDGGFSIEPFYWGTAVLPQLPVMKGGAQSSYSNANYNYPGIIKQSPGGILSIPAGRQSTIRLSYFRTQGRGTETLANDITVLGGTAFVAGEFISSTYTLQDAKVSWDFYTYPLPPGPRRIRIKTLWEAQWLLFHTNIWAPYQTTSNSTGNAIPNYAAATKNLFLPTLGAEIEQAPYKHFRYELKADGFTIPHRGNIWEAEGSMAFRFGQVELLAGAKVFHFKTSPKSDEYISDTLSGPYVGLRYYMSRSQ